ncbi:MAG: DUF4252 domain-containing protein [Chitinophagaceae bacterium]|nr:DUF4252 domain-containing protein [Chitinophagaceae bacterium]
MTKIVITLIALILFPFLSFSQNRSLSALQKKYKDGNVLTLSLTGNILKFLGDPKAENDPERMRLAQKISSLHILAVSNKSEGYSSRDIRKLKKEIRKQSFEEVISLKSSGGQLQLLVRDQNGEPNELIMILDKDADGFITMDLSESNSD